MKVYFPKHCGLSKYFLSAIITLPDQTFVYTEKGLQLVNVAPEVTVNVAEGVVTK